MRNIKPHIIKFEKKGNLPEGYLSIVDCEKNHFFKVKRTYWTYSTPSDIIRGKHAHKKSFQILVAVSGEIEVELIDINLNTMKFILNNPNEGLLIPPNYWHTMKYSTGAVQLILSSTSYSLDDYIRDFNDFLNYWKNK
ncbi:MAG: FdtA/QdtA family cupin domain-containing protein [Bacteroidetes bacterium]|nr:FdtA/QdtA family cupin domain-containing protein [Bacteroidota bacterium]